ncbi:hypothetical protein [Patulibacter defluvii]|uniref:hypothetical protein n=1 Tax=Patulibacter defluvii TaxID=3095358 RepID=UPI002A74E96A|nr:hypothetical protein [Patulibacter sp. DM4]
MRLDRLRFASWTSHARHLLPFNDVLAALPFDISEPLVRLTVDIVQDVLARWADGRIGDEDLQSWADALEVRDDVEPEPPFRDVLKDCLFELSEPTLAGKPMSALALEWRGRFTKISAR